MTATKTMTRAEMIAAAAAFDALQPWQQWELPMEEQRMCTVWDLAANLSRGFREFPTLEIPTTEEIETLYTADPQAAHAAVRVLNQKYRSGYSHSAKIAGVAVFLDRK
jgi:hypothetical protein